jgi:hypothetical protein
MNTFLFLNVLKGDYRINSGHICNMFDDVDDEELDSPAVRSLGVRSRKLNNALNGQSWDG